MSVVRFLPDSKPKKSFYDFFPFFFLVLEWFLEKHVHMSVKLGISLIANTQAQLGEAMNLLWSLTGAWLTQASISSKSPPTSMCDDS